tara:strand:- start:2752 stop:3114 length:363 start_codon:yes stop_codon:yes gene_type:complete
MEKFVYIMSCQRGQGIPEIHYMCDNYNEAIKAYYDHQISDQVDFLDSPDREYWFMNLYKFPLGVSFRDEGHRSSSRIKISKSSKYRIKFKTYGDLINEYKITNRNQAIDEVCEDMDLTKY